MVSAVGVLGFDADPVLRDAPRRGRTYDTGRSPPAAGIRSRWTGPASSAGRRSPAERRIRKSPRAAGWEGWFRRVWQRRRRADWQALFLKKVIRYQDESCEDSD